MKKIMLCYDGSLQAKRALDVTKLHAKGLNAILHVVYYLKQNLGVNEKDVDRMEKADQQLEDLKNSLEEDQISCRAHLMVNVFSPGEALIEYADQNNIGEIVVGIKRSSKVGKLVFGSTAQYIILKSSCPVVSVR